VQFPPNVIACAAIYLAGRITEHPFPIDPQTGSHLLWWKIFGVTFEDLSYVAASILELYQPSFMQDSQSHTFIDQVTKTLHANQLEAL